MATNPNRLRVTELDFDTIKTNLKTFLQAQDEFTDYDFEGSGMNILMDTLAYNTHYLAMNANMVANEMFIDSASIRSSIVSHAKTLGYEVSSSRAPKGLIDIRLNTTALDSATMPAGTVFNTTVDGTSYQFVTIEDLSASRTGTYIQFDNTAIYEGTYVTSRYTVDSSDLTQKFTIPSDKVDTTTLTVKVQNSSTDTFTTTFTKATDITQVTSDSNVYFLQETFGGKFEVYFGDGVIGKKVTDNNIVILQYVVTNETKANGALKWTNSGAIATVSDVDVIRVQQAAGGSTPETLQSIKQNAPLDYAAQGRCVTTSDYEVYVKKLFANTKSVSVWGGETGSYDTSLGVVDTPEYGKVYISVKSTTGNNLTETEKKSLENELGRYKVASITPVVVDPETLFLILNTRFKMDTSKTTKTIASVASDIISTLQTHNDNVLAEFNSPFRHSEVVGKIDNTNSAITSNITNITMGKKLLPTLNTNINYNVYFRNKLYNPHSGHNSTGGGVIASTGFKVNGDINNVQFFDEDGNGKLRRYYFVGGERTYIDANAGTVDYNTGHVKINAINISSIEDVDGQASSMIRLTAIPDSKDIIPVRNQILEIDFVNSTVSGVVDSLSISSSSTSGAEAATTTSSYSNTSAY
tara:strand:- start:3370 stop:5283 length:1914 start_codon:yes stop_codon:yes gene_type:complete